MNTLDPPPPDSKYPISNVVPLHRGVYSPSPMYGSPSAVTPLRRNPPLPLAKVE